MKHEPLSDWLTVNIRSVLYGCLGKDKIVFLISLCQLAMASLIRGNELELAVFVGTVLGESASKATHYVLELLARKYMTTATW